MLVTRLTERHDTLDRNITSAERNKMPSASYTDNADRELMELRAKLLGLMQETHQPSNWWSAKVKPSAQVSSARIHCLKRRQLAGSRA